MKPSLNPDTYPLTQYSHGAGCGCKIAPDVLTEILGSHSASVPSVPGLLVGNDTRDDAAVFDLGDGTGLVSTTDFFMPITDDAKTFGYIASVNAISDVYAMGGTPLMAIAILGWPIDTIPASIASQVIEGARSACAAAGIPLAGGHSIDSPEPIFGLAVSGRVDLTHLKRNTGAQPGDHIFLTKPLGIGAFSTAQKKGILSGAHLKLSTATMMQLNAVGSTLGKLDSVHAMTDVTGFGLAGHLIEVCEGSGIAAEIEFDALPLLEPHALHAYLDAGAIPGGTIRNYRSCAGKIGQHNERQWQILCDPQTSGGLLVFCAPEQSDAVAALLDENGLYAKRIGKCVPEDQTDIRIHLK